jgi:hypothetical protein
MLRNSSCHVQVPGHFMTRLRYLCQVARSPLGGRTRWKSPCPLPVAIFAVRRMDVRFEQRASICADLLHEAQNDATFVNSITAEDESWCFQYDMARRTATWEYRGYSSGCDDGAHRHSERRIHQLLSGLAALATVYWLRREVLRRGQEALVVRLNFVFFTDSVSELYGQRMYVLGTFPVSLQCRHFV